MRAKAKDLGEVTKADRRAAKKQRKAAPVDNRKSIRLISTLSTRERK